MSAKVVGRLVLTLPSGRSHVIGTSGDIAEVSVLSFQAVWKCMRRGTIGFADAYLVGEVSTPDLGAVFRFFIDNRPILSAEGRGAFQVRAAD
ncbi:MAG: SAM-dependent methyltransferase, partial [Pseudomonadota bacterium]